MAPLIPRIGSAKVGSKHLIRPGSDFRGIGSAVTPGLHFLELLFFGPFGLALCPSPFAVLALVCPGCALLISV